MEWWEAGSKGDDVDLAENSAALNQVHSLISKLSQQSINIELGLVIISFQKTFQTKERALPRTRRVSTALQAGSKGDDVDLAENSAALTLLRLWHLTIPGHVGQHGKI